MDYAECGEAASRRDSSRPRGSLTGCPIADPDVCATDLSAAKDPDFFADSFIGTAKVVPFQNFSGTSGRTFLPCSPVPGPCLFSLSLGPWFPLPSAPCSPVPWSLFFRHRLDGEGCAKSDVEPDCSFWIRMPSVEKAAGPRRRPFSKRNTATSPGFAEACRMMARSRLKGRTIRRRESAPFHALHLRMERSGRFEFEIGRGLVALGAERDQAAFAARGEKFLDSGGLFARSARRCSPCSRARGTSSSRSRRSRDSLGRDEIEGAAAQQKELERFFGVALGGCARREWPVCPIGFALAGPVGDRDARVGIAAEKTHEGRMAQMHPL